MMKLKARGKYVVATRLENKNTTLVLPDQSNNVVAKVKSVSEDEECADLKEGDVVLVHFVHKDNELDDEILIPQSQIIAIVEDYE